MSATIPADGITAPLPYRSPWERWRDFWFRPADPTTLGFIRIATGLLVLYIFLTYSLDLQGFFGPHGWYAGRYIERERHEAPYFVQPLLDKWDDPPLTTAQLTDFPHRRKALIEYLRALPADPHERAAALAYLNRANAYPDPAEVRATLFYVQRMGADRQSLELSLAALTDRPATRDNEKGDQKSIDLTASYKAAIPAHFRELPLDQRKQIADEIRAFWTVLANVPWSGDANQARNFVFNHFLDVVPESRKALIDYMNTLPADDAERTKLLDYLEYWNTDPRVAYRTGSSIFSLWFHVTDPTEMALVHTGVLVLIVLFTVGLFTRVTSALVWLATVSYIHRTQQVLFGMDTMMNILLFYLMIGNSGAALSVDRLIGRYRAVRASLRRGGTLDANTRAYLGAPPPSVGAGFALRLIQIHFCFIYVAAGLSKLKGATWWNGVAFWEVVVNPEFTLMQYQWYEATIRWIGSSKLVYHTLNAFAVWFTLFVEIAGPFLLWTRLRWLIIFLATAMHAGIAVLMGLNLFELLMICMLLAFLPDRCIRDRFRGGLDLPKLTFLFNPQTATHARAAALTAASDIDNQVTLAPNPSATATELVGPDGKSTTGPNGVGTLFRGLRLLSALGFVLWIPGVRGLAARYLFPSRRDHYAGVKPPAVRAAR